MPKIMMRDSAGVERSVDAEILSRLALDGSRSDSPFEIDSTPFFGRCDDELISLYKGGQMGLMDLFNWQVSETYKRTLNFITYVRPEMSGGNPTSGAITDPCADPDSFEFGTSDLTVEDFGLYGRSGPVRFFQKPKKYCKTDPKYFLDGSPITTERDWDIMAASDVMQQDLFRDIIVGNASNAGEFDGVNRWIKTGYNSSMLDSLVIDWAGNDMEGNGGGTITINGVDMTVSADIVDMILSLYRRFKQLRKWSPMLTAAARTERDTVLVMPQFLTECLLDKYTCWRVCEGKQFNETNLNSADARKFRDSLIGGLYGAGKITLDGDTIHLFPYDWETMHGSNRGDMYFMNINAGTTRLWEGEILDSSKTAKQVNSEGHNEYFSIDGGRILGTSEVDNLCKKIKLWTSPRLWCRAPWMQARIMNVECATILDPLSPDPLKTSFYPLTSFGGDKRTIS